MVLLAVFKNQAFWCLKKKTRDAGVRKTGAWGGKFFLIDQDFGHFQVGNLQEQMEYLQKYGKQQENVPVQVLPKQCQQIWRMTE